LNNGYKPVQILMLSSLFGTAFLVAITPLTESVSLGFSVEMWEIILFLAVVSTFLPYTMWYMAMEKTEVSRLSSFVYFVPVFATVFSYMLLGERITWTAAIAASAIIVGVATAQTHRNLNAM